MKPIRYPILIAGVLMLATLPALAAPPTGKGYVTVFEDNFSGTSLNTANWSHNYAWGTYHNHMANMNASQVTVSGGFLNLKAENFRSIWQPWGVTFEGFGYLPFDYTSGAINSFGKKQFTRGYFEARIKMPPAESTWPAFWMLSGVQWPPEFDIAEVENERTRNHNTYHYTDAAGVKRALGGAPTVPDTSAAFHTYGLEWTASELIFYFDDVQQGRYAFTDPLNQANNMYMILNLAVGGWSQDPVASDYPQTMQVDYVRVSQSSNPDFSGTYEFRNRKSGKLLDVAGGSTANAAYLDIYTDNNWNRQRWVVTSVGAGYYKIINANSGKSFDVNGASTANGAAAIQYTYGGGDNQLFRFDYVSGGYYRITPKHSGKCLGVSGGGTANGTAVIQWSWLNSTDQMWQLNKQY